jgi:signal transduction histidine kinase
MVNGDADRLSDVVLNLLINTIKHAQGTPHVNVRLRVQPDVTEIDVEDFGPGIPPDALTRIFDRHRQVLSDERTGSANSGLGLGLFIAQQTVAAHGGRLDVESTPGVGSRFTIRLPLS